VRIVSINVKEVERGIYICRCPSNPWRSRRQNEDSNRRCAARGKIFYWARRGDAAGRVESSTAKAVEGHRRDG
jgi:hypothetical protein